MEKNCNNKRQVTYIGFIYASTQRVAETGHVPTIGIIDHTDRYVKQKTQVTQMFIEMWLSFSVASYISGASLMSNICSQNLN